MKSCLFEIQMFVIVLVNKLQIQKWENWNPQGKTQTWWNTTLQAKRRLNDKIAFERPGSLVHHCKEY